MNPEKKNPDTFVAICLRCGMALKIHEISVQIDGQTIDFNEHIAIQNTNYNLCCECSDVVKSYLEKGIKAGIERRKTLSLSLEELDLKPVVIGS
jgi:hypothetical protein